MTAPRTADAGLSSEMAFDILAYATERPNAQDTFEGILEWWLLERFIARQGVAVRAALDELVAKGFLEAREGSDQREHYRLNPSRRRQAKSLLARHEKEQEGAP